MSSPRTLPSPRPFFKYAGSKRRLADVILERLRLTGGGYDGGYYFEPFVGGGAVFLAARAAGYRGPAVLGDASPVLVTVWRAVRDDPDGVIEAFARHAAQHGRDYYLEVRKRRPSGAGGDYEAALAGWFLYVNKACFNGLWRVNRRGELNTPFGDGRPVSIDTGAIHAAAGALGTGDVGVICADFAHFKPHRGDRIYCDPPYLPASPSANFASYTRDGFGVYDQHRLARWARDAADRGALVVVSNAHTAEAASIFGALADRIEVVETVRTISRDADGRGRCGEYLFTFG